jgi:uncharacterized protein (DUF433 family)
MQLEEFLEFDTEPCERIRIAGTRVNLEHVIELYTGGMTPEQIYAYFGSWPPLENIYASITYYLANKDAVDAYIARVEADFQKRYQEHLNQPVPDVVSRMRALKAKRLAKV